MLIYSVPAISTAETLAATIDCSNVEIDYTDNPEWTNSERIDAMNKAFFESLNRFELCNLSNQTSAASASGAEQASNNNDGTGQGSVASSTMTGTEEQAGNSANNTAASNDTSSSEATSQQSAAKNKGGGSTNGGKAEDIPSADNDDVIAAQIRLAAEIEQDPAKKEKLWNEYRKYKGLPSQ
ncbi:MAG: hypothetical protein COA83_11650 [Methylophaga sp.]|nr:MAG: hypothetical protein COA83_11650 [Methylophaga sp.]